MHSAIFSAWSSDSMTHGPAMRNSPPSPRVSLPSWKEVAKGFEGFPGIGSFGGSDGYSAETSEPTLGSRYFLRAQEVLHLGRFLVHQPLEAVVIRRLDECREQRVRLERLGLELGVELAAEEIRMLLLRQLDDFDIGTIGRRAGDAQACRGQRLLVFAVELVPMAMTLADLDCTVRFRGE